MAIPSKISILLFNISPLFTIILLGFYDLCFNLPILASFIFHLKQTNVSQGQLKFHGTLIYLLLSFPGPLLVGLSIQLLLIAGVSTWIGGPSKGLMAVVHHGYLPRVLQKVNQNGIKQNILIVVQGCIVTVLIFLFTFMPSVQPVYQILSQLTAILYLVMYMMLFAAGIALRIKEPEQPRPYRIPWGNAGMFVIGGVGFLGAFIAFALSFLQPAQIKVGSTTIWCSILIIGAVVFLALPLIIYALRRPGWKSELPQDAIEPFSWEHSEK